MANKTTKEKQKKCEKKHMTQLSYTSCRKSPNIESSIFLINSKEQNICSNSTHIDTQHYGGNSVLKNAC